MSRYYSPKTRREGRATINKDILPIYLGEYIMHQSVKSGNVEV